MSTSEWLINLYATSLRGELFNGFLASGSFLLAATTFIVVTMKQEVYSTPKYRLKHEERTLIGHRKTLYEPLKQLTRSLTLATLLSLICSFAQMTIGLIPNIWPVAACLAVAVLAALALFQSLFFLSQNLRSFLDHLEAADVPAPAESEALADPDS